jgi:hypothetical protein
MEPKEIQTVSTVSDDKESSDLDLDSDNLTTHFFLSRSTYGRKENHKGNFVLSYEQAYFDVPSRA